MKLTILKWAIQVEFSTFSVLHNHHLYLVTEQFYQL